MADNANTSTPDAGELNKAARDKLAKSGLAMPDGSYPIRNKTDLQKAVRAVGRGSGSHDAIRRHIIKRARALGLMDLIPDDWKNNSGGRSLIMADVERRFTPGLVEKRDGEKASKIAGYAAVFDKPSRNLGGFVEEVRNTAFNRTRSHGWPDVVARYNHDSNMLLGTTAGRTLDLAIHDAGLWYEVNPPQSRSDILELVQRGDVRNSSFAFRTVNDEWGTTDQGYPLRSLHEVKLVDVAPVLDPAYPDATSFTRAFTNAYTSLAEHVGASVDEVRTYAEQDELRRFFVRTDTASTKTPAKRTFGPMAMMELLAKKNGPAS